MRPKPGLADVARTAGVSMGTASNVLNNPDRVRPATRAKVYRAMRDLGYGHKGVVFPADPPVGAAPVPEWGGDRPFLMTLGYISVDFLARIDVMPHRNDRVTGERISKHLGGPAANVAVAAAGLGGPFALDVELATAIGRDPDSLWALEQLAQRGVRARAIRHPERHRLSRCIVLLESDGSRTKVNEPLTLSGPELLPRLPSSPVRRRSHLHADGYQAGVILPLADRLHELGFTLSVHDTGLDPSHFCGDGFADLVRRMDLAFLNRRSAGWILGQSLATSHLIAAFARHLTEIADRNDVVLTLGPDGAVVFPRDATEPLRVMAPSTDVVDGTGAGDSFIGCYLAQRLHQVDPAMAAERACRAASLNMTAEGAQGRIASAADLGVTELLAETGAP
ncbi:LacI family DNA-binding transcriptional regulator [Maribius pontilimi]|uniref:LacI family DNA-binding transcriptional regulator n=1 Tax=Palleronia pontilimi TaxID=1964209 RepID=A0A934II63_9RHOB|nr:PfkB family carbohydrate kinase [Palleronia pontilimi]MBJ3763810.1 LacI family DNA-binding transcriptional regulator [Palleronia pontilimi]